MKKLVQVVVQIVVILLIVVVVRTMVMPSKQVGPQAFTPEGVNAGKAAQDLAGSIGFETISYEGGGTPEEQAKSQEAFNGLHAYLAKTFPRVYETLQFEQVGKNNLLFTWKGTDANLKPMILMGHQDVVPVEEGTEGKWTHPAFSGEIADGFVWGRGTMDDKVSVVGLLEAANLLVEKGFKPRRTVYLAFGQDEEIGGTEGAAKIAELLKSRGVEAEFVLDEGGFISTGLVPGVKKPVAMIGTAEKGYLSVELEVETAGGHSSVPPPESSIGILGAAVAKLEANKMPAHTDGPIGVFLEYAGGEAQWPMKAVFKNLWLFGPVVKKELESSPDSNATLRTTTAPTIFKAGTKDNVLPSVAKATVNFRLLPGDTVAAVLEHVKTTVNDPRVKVRPMPGEPPVEASPESDPGAPEFVAMQKKVKQVFPDAVTAPFLFIAATDSKYFAGVSKNVYRFAPIRLGPEDVARYHGTNERVSVEGFKDAVEFYALVMKGE